MRNAITINKTAQHLVRRRTRGRQHAHAFKIWRFEIRNEHDGEPTQKACQLVHNCQVLSWYCNNTYTSNLGSNSSHRIALLFIAENGCVEVRKIRSYNTSASPAPAFNR